MGNMVTRSGAGTFDRSVRHGHTSWRGKCYEIVFTNVNFPGRDEGGQMVFTSPSDPYRLKPGVRYNIKVYYNPDISPRESTQRNYPMYIEVTDIPVQEKGP